MTDWRNRFNHCGCEEEKRLLSWEMRQEQADDALGEDELFVDQSDYYLDPKGKVMPFPKYQFNLREIQSFVNSLPENERAFALEGLFAKYDEIYRRADSEWLSYLGKVVRAGKL